MTDWRKEADKAMAAAYYTYGSEAWNAERRFVETVDAALAVLERAVAERTAGLSRDIEFWKSQVDDLMSRFRPYGEGLVKAERERCLVIVRGVRVSVCDLPEVQRAVTAIQSG